MVDEDAGSRRVAVIRVAAGVQAPARDAVACEEPLEIQVRGVSVAVLMRTPGHDEELARGFLVSERIVGSADQILAVRHCRVVADPAAEDNVVAVSLRDDVALDLEALRRNFVSSASCGVCGKATIEQALATAPPLDVAVRVAPAVVREIMAALAAAQPLFAATGGMHAAGLFTVVGERRVVREDVGRHNAVDKVIGWACARGVPPAGHVLAVSGRISFEIAQKALAARIPIVAAVSAPTSLAVDLAERAGLTLIGFARGERCNVYGNARRVG
ncbi:formate dehydrogenase accessory sulfurtransferase FdhD [bacterium]|nr:formate dehydrogenase accessory sulfurtransferase FdhD [bacterium]